VEMPLSVCGPRSWHSNKPAINRWVAALSTTLSGSLRQPLHAGGDVGGLAQRQLLPPAPTTHLAHHDGAGVNADADL
jgi:hypothetical protein